MGVNIGDTRPPQPSAYNRLVNMVGLQRIIDKDLSNLDLSMMVLPIIDYTDFTFENSILTGVTFEGERSPGLGGSIVPKPKTFVRANFTNTIISSGIFRLSNFTSAIFNRTTAIGTIFNNSSLRGITFISCLFNNSNMTAVDLRTSKFIKSMLNYVTWTNAYIQDVEFEETDSDGGNIEDAIYSYIADIRV